MEESAFIKELMLVLATAGIVVPIFGRLGLGPVIGFLIAGVALGPGGVGRLVADYPWLRHVTFGDVEGVRPFAELGVLFLLFLIGLEFSFARLWALRRAVLGVGSLQCAVAALLIGGAALALGADLPTAIVTGLALSLSSTAIVSQVMIEQRRFAAPIGRLAIGVLLFQDLMVVPIVIVVGLLAGEAPSVPLAVMKAVASAIVAVTVILVAGRFVARPLLRLAAASDSRELVVAVALLLAIGTGLATEMAGLSSALGAFLAGLLLGESEYSHQLEVEIEPFKGLLLGVFFMTVGMNFDLAALGGAIPVLVAAAAGLVVLKAVATFAAARGLGSERAIAIEAAFLLAGTGEFAFVVFTLARRDGLLPLGTYQFLLPLTGLTMLATPGLAGIGRRLAGRVVARRATDRHGAAEAEAELSDHVVIGGFGRVGRTVARVLDSEAIPYVAMDIDPERVARARADGRPVFYGDVSRREILERIGAAKARAFVVTTDDPEVTARMVAAIHAAWPEAAVHARARDMDQAARLAKLGVADVVPEALEGSLQLAGRVLGGFGLPADAVDARLASARNREINHLAEERTVGR